MSPWEGRPGDLCRVGSRAFRPARPGLLLALLGAAGTLGCAGASGPPAPTTGSPPGAPSDASTAAWPSAPSGAIEVIVLQMNDVYEITPVEAGRSGGLARVATLRRRLEKETPNVVTVLAGDFLSPSAMGTAVVDGEALAGRQMVAVLDAAGLDWVTLGNHEFDVGREAFLARLGESRFRWVSGNVTDASGEPFPGVEPRAVLTFEGEGGAAFRLGLLGATLRAGYPEWVRAADPLGTLAAQARDLRPRVDALVALTHLELEQDMELARTVPEIDLILGGHEHENWEVRRGSDFTPVLKADANARSVYVHRLRWDPAGAGLSVDSELVPVTGAVPEDPETAAVVEDWVEQAFDAFRAAGFAPEAVVASMPEAMDGREASVRNRSTALTELVAEAVLAAAPGAEAALFNAGSIRIDDVLPPGPLTQYDVIRILPFGGRVVEVEIAGGLLRRVLEQSAANRGTGGLLHGAGVEAAEGGGWHVGGEPLSEARTYRLAVNDFLLSGRETGLDFLRPGHPDLRVLGERGDVRQAVIDLLEERWASRQELALPGGALQVVPEPWVGDPHQGLHPLSEVLAEEIGHPVLRDHVMDIGAAGDDAGAFLQERDDPGDLAAPGGGGQGDHRLAPR